MRSARDSPAGNGGNLSVAVVGAEPADRIRMRMALAHEGLVVVTEAGSVPELPDKCADVRPDAVVLALNGHGIDSTRSVHLLIETLPGVPVVLVSPDPRAVGWKDLEAGADGLVLDSEVEPALAAAVIAVCAGQVTLPRRVREKRPRPVLSFREKQVLGMVVLGFTNGEIAMRLHLAESTIKSHLSSAFTKLGVRSRSEAADAIMDPDGGLGPGILAISEPEAGAESDLTVKVDR